MDNETLMTTATETAEGADASTQATQDAATAAATEGQQTAATEQTAAAPAEQQPGEQQPKPTEAPESYEFKPVEGANVAPEVLESFAGIAKKHGLPQDVAQDVLNTMAPAIAAQQQAQIAAITAEWGQQAAADQEYGGDKLQENLATAKKALDAFGTPEFTKLLNESGLGNHPEVIRVFYRAGKAISEDSKLVTGRQTSGQASDARRLYAASNMNP